MKSAWRAMWVWALVVACVSGCRRDGRSAFEAAGGRDVTAGAPVDLRQETVDFLNEAKLLTGEAAAELALSSPSAEDQESRSGVVAVGVDY